MMINIDYIMRLIDWNSPTGEQERGMKMAENLENINVFLRPCNKNANKNVWENCAKILSQRMDDELFPYLVELLEWLQDLNWPGAFCILERLKKYDDVLALNNAINTCLKCAHALGDSVWECNLQSIVAHHNSGTKAIK